MKLENSSLVDKNKTMNKSQKGFNNTNKAKARREVVITRLSNQLKSGVKLFDGKEKDEIELVEINNVVYAKLLEKDIKRIQKELQTLKSRV